MSSSAFNAAIILAGFAVLAVLVVLYWVCIWLGEGG